MDELIGCCSAWSKLNTEIGLPTTSNFWTIYRQCKKLQFSMQPYFNPNRREIKMFFVHRPLQAEHLSEADFCLFVADNWPWALQAECRGHYKQPFFLSSLITSLQEVGFIGFWNLHAVFNSQKQNFCSYWLGSSLPVQSCYPGSLVRENNTSECTCLNSSR